METAPKIETPLKTVRNIGNFLLARARGGGWAELPAIPSPVVERVARLRDPVELGWELVPPEAV